MKKFIGFLCLITVILTLFIGLFSLTKSQTHAQGTFTVPAGPISYNYSNGKISELINSHTTGNVFSGVEKLSGELLRRGYPGYYGCRPAGDYTTGGLIMSELGYLAFPLESNKNFYLVVDPLSSVGLGIYYKNWPDKKNLPDKYFYSWTYTTSESGKWVVKYMVPSSGSEWINTANSATVPDSAGVNTNIIDIVRGTNGQHMGVAAGDFTGKGCRAPVTNLYKENIKEGTKICGKATIDFSTSTSPDGTKSYYDRLKPEGRSLAPKDKVQWPSAFFVAGATNIKVPLYVQYKFENTFVTAPKQFGLGLNGFVNIKNDVDGTWNIDMSGLPAGTYKIYPEFFLKCDGDKCDETRPDTPTQGSIQDWWDRGQANDKNIEVFTIKSFEFTVDKDGKVSDSTLTDCSKVLDLKSKGFWDADRLNANGDNKSCDIGGKSDIISLIQQGLCGITVTLKLWADGFFNWAVSWMERSIGIARNQSGDAPDEFPTFDTGVGTSSQSSSQNTSNSSSGTTNSNNTNASSSGQVLTNRLTGIGPTMTDAAVKGCQDQKNFAGLQSFSAQPCLTQKFFWHDSATAPVIDSGYGIQIVNGGIETFNQNNKQPNYCGTSKLIILKTDCSASGKSE